MQQIPRHQGLTWFYLFPILNNAALNTLKQKLFLNISLVSEGLFVSAVQLYQKGYTDLCSHCPHQQHWVVPLQTTANP